MIQIVESGMTFTFQDADCFRMEKDPVITSNDCVKTCEFVGRVTRKGTDLYLFVEAKSSAPKEKLCDRNKLLYDGASVSDSWKISTDFDCFVDDICTKFEDSYSVYRAMLAEYHGADAKSRIPAGCRGAEAANINFMLIINGFKDEWLPPLNDAIKKRLRHFLNAWHIPGTSVKTLNKAGAASLGVPVV